MLQSLSDSNTSHISEAVCIISLPDTVVKWFYRNQERLSQDGTVFILYRITGWLRLESASGPPPAQTGSVTGSFPGSFTFKFCLHRQTLHNFSAQPVPMFDHPQSKNMLSFIQMECCVF